MRSRAGSTITFDCWNRLPETCPTSSRTRWRRSG
jgi:hypothetical protein